MNPLETKKNILPKPLAACMLLSLLLAPAAPLAAQTAEINPIVQDALTKKIPLADIIHLPKEIIGTTTVENISQVDWQQNVKIGGKEVALSSPEALAAIDVPQDIQTLVENYRSATAAVDSSLLTLPSNKIDEKQHLTEALQNGIAQSLIEQGVLPSNYPELKADGLVESADRIIDVTKVKSMPLPAAAVGVPAHFSATMTNAKSVDTARVRTLSPRTASVENASAPTRQASSIGGQSASAHAGLQYLLGRQNANGSWGSGATQFTDTTAVLDALYAYGETGVPYQKGIAWLTYYVTDNNEYLAEQLTLSAQAGEATTSAEDLAYAVDQSTGGFAFDTRYESDPATTAKALQALTRAHYEDPGANPTLTLTLAAYYLIQTQRFDKGWSGIRGGDSSMPVTTDAIEALLPFKGQVLNGFGTATIAINDTLNPALDALKLTQMPNGSWNNTLLDTALAFYTLKQANVSALYASEAATYLGNAQASDGSFGGDLYTTAHVLKALSLPDSAVGGLTISAIVPLTALQNASPALIRVDLQNNSDSTVDSGILHVVADHYVIFNVDFRDNGIRIDPHQTQQLVLHIDNTTGYEGNVLFDAFVEGKNGTSYPDSRYEKTLAFAAEPSQMPGLPIYFTAEKYVINGQPALNVRWGQKDDPNRLSYLIMYRLKGTTAWNYFPIDNRWNGAYLAGFPEDQLYEVTVGALAHDGARYTYYNTDLVPVKTSSNWSTYAGSVSGTLRDIHGPVPNVTVLAASGFTESDKDGNLTVSNAPYGRGWIRALDNRYEEYVTTYTTAGNAVTGVNAYTNLKPDTQKPSITDLSLQNEWDYTLNNKQKKVINASVTDDVAVASATFSYYDPNDRGWHLITTEQGPFYGPIVSYDWYIPGTLLGPGYKIKAVIRDYSGKESDPVEWGPFTLTPGNAAPEFSFVTPTLSAPAEADLSYTVSWNDRDDEDNAAIYLFYDPDQEVNNGNSVFLGTFHEDDFLNQYTWNTSTVAEGTYYLRALVSDEYNPTVIVTSDKPVTITHHAPTSPTALHLWGQTDPNPVNVSAPAFLAVFNDPRAGALAAYYRIEIATSSAFSPLTWDSGKTELASTTPTGSSIHSISYTGNTLQPSTTYYWRIKFWDFDGNEGAWSTPPASFTTADSRVNTPRADTTAGTLIITKVVPPKSPPPRPPPYTLPPPPLQR